MIYNLELTNNFFFLISDNLFMLIPYQFLLLLKILNNLAQ
jgi:hypothetical protein